MQSPNWLWLIWKYSPSIVHCQSFTERFALVPEISHNMFLTIHLPTVFRWHGSRIFSFWPWEKWVDFVTSMLTRAETDDKLVYVERLRSCISLLKDVFLQSTILTATQILRWTFSRASLSRGVASVTSHQIQSEPLHRRESKVRHVAFRSILWSTKLYISGTRANFSVKLWQWTIEGEYF